MKTRSLAVGTFWSDLCSLSRPFLVGFTLVAIPYFSCKKSPTHNHGIRIYRQKARGQTASVIGLCSTRKGREGSKVWGIKQNKFINKN